MRVFVTGGTGLIGSAVVDALLQGGHRVTVLTRTPAKAAALRKKGATLHEGGIQDPQSYAALAGEHEALVHMAIDYAKDTVQSDRTAIDTLVAAAGKSKPRLVVYTSGCWVLGPTGDRPADESAGTDHPAQAVAWRPPHERLVLSAAGDGLVTAVVRPGMVYGGAGGMIGPLFASAVERQPVSVVGDGTNRWSLVHREDLAQLYRVIVERHVAGIYHGVDGAPMTVADVGRAASRAAGADGVIALVPLAEARRKLGPVADAICMDQVLAAPRARALGWAPTCASFSDCAPRAFREWSATRSA